jgi:hypothetical protein
VKRPKGLPFIRMEKEGEVMQIHTQFVQVGWNPNLAIMARRNSHSILSKAFSMSILRAMRPPLPGFKGVEEFMGQNRVVLNISGRNKSRLEGGDDVMEQGI